MDTRLLTVHSSKKSMKNVDIECNAYYKTYKSLKHMQALENKRAETVQGRGFLGHSLERCGFTKSSLGYGAKGADERQKSERER